MPRVCHISPVHALVDNRIFHKQCRSLCDAGYEVYWVVQHERDSVIDGIHVVSLQSSTSRIRRWLLSGWEAFRKALSTKSDVYHFHDPEFIPMALLLRGLGHRVVYDIHEDYVSSISQKSYIPGPLRYVVSRLAGLTERLLSSSFQRVIAERYYEDRFPTAIKVLNYPRLTQDGPRCKRSDQKLLYTGKVHLYRGALEHAKIPGLVAGTTVDYIGRCAPDLHAQIVAANREHADQLQFTGIAEFVPFSEIAKQYQQGAWLAGLAIFPPNEHLDKKELTKFFEYMQYGLPIIASNFPTWRRLVEDNGCGICVDPTSDSEIASAVTRLRDDPALWQSMSDNGFRVVREKFAWDSQEVSLLQMYEAILQK